MTAILVRFQDESVKLDDVEEHTVLTALLLATQHPVG